MPLEKIRILFNVYISCNAIIVSFNIAVVSKIVFNYSKSEVKHLVENKHTPNADHDLKCFLALCAPSDEHPSKDLSQLVSLIETIADDIIYISTRPKSFDTNWGSEFFTIWGPVLKTNSFTDEGKMAWTRACGLEMECE